MDFFKIGKHDFTFIREMRVPMDRVSPGTHRGLFGFSRSLRGLFRVSLRYLWGFSRVTLWSLWGLFRVSLDYLGVFWGSFWGLWGVSLDPLFFIILNIQLN